MGIGAVVVICGQRAEQIDIRGELRLLPESVRQGLIVQSGIAVGLRQKIILIGDHREVDLGVGPGHEGFVEIAEPIGGVGNGAFIQGIFQLGGGAVCQIDAVVVLLAEHIQPHQGFQGAELLPQRELVRGVILVAGHEFAGEIAACGQFRHLGQRAALTDGERIGGLDRRPDAKSQNKRGQEPHREAVFPFFRHGGTSFKSGNTGTG